jgi:hypothetical protein
MTLYVNESANIFSAPAESGVSFHPHPLWMKLDVAWFPIHREGAAHQ